MRDVIDKRGLLQWPYPLSIMIADKSICVRPRYPVSIIEVFQRRYAISKKRVPQRGSVAEPVGQGPNELRQQVRVELPTLVHHHYRCTSPA
jgi:hypothetical protein